MGYTLWGTRTEIPSAHEARPNRGILQWAKQVFRGWLGPRISEHNQQGIAVVHEKVSGGPPGIVFPWFLPNYDDHTRETLEMRRVYASMISSPAVKAAFMSKIMAVASLDLRIRPARKRNKRDSEIAEFVRWNLTERLSGGVPGMIWSILSGGLINGYSVCEKVFQFEEKGMWASKAALSALKPKDVDNTVILLTDEYLNIVGVQALKYNPAQVVHPSNFVIYRHTPLYDSPTGTSDFRAAYGSYVMLDAIRKLRAMGAERHAIPILGGEWSDASQQPALEKALSLARSQSWLSWPKGCQIKAIEIAGSSNEYFQSMVKDLEHEIFLSLVGAILQSVEGTTTDARGNSQVHRSITEQWTWFLSECIQSLLNDRTNGLIKDIVDLNFVTDAYPVATLSAVDVNEMMAEAQLDKILLDTGLKLSRTDMYDRYGRVPPDDEQDSIESPQASMLKQQAEAQKQQTESSGPPESPEEPENSGGPEAPGGSNGPSNGSSDDVPLEDLKDFDEWDNFKETDWRMEVGPRGGMVWRNVKNPDIVRWGLHNPGATIGRRDKPRQMIAVLTFPSNKKAKLYPAGWESEDDTLQNKLNKRFPAGKYPINQAKRAAKFYHARIQIPKNVPVRHAEEDWSMMPYVKVGAGKTGRHKWYNHKTGEIAYAKENPGGSNSGKKPSLTDEQYSRLKKTFSIASRNPKIITNDILLGLSRSLTRLTPDQIKDLSKNTKAPESLEFQKAYDALQKFLNKSQKKIQKDTGVANKVKKQVDLYAKDPLKYGKHLPKILDNLTKLTPNQIKMIASKASKAIKSVNLKQAADAVLKYVAKKQNIDPEKLKNQYQKNSVIKSTGNEAVDKEVQEGMQKEGFGKLPIKYPDKPKKPKTPPKPLPSGESSETKTTTAKRNLKKGNYEVTDKAGGKIAEADTKKEADAIAKKVDKKQSSKKTTVNKPKDKPKGKPKKESKNKRHEAVDKLLSGLDKSEGLTEDQKKYYHEQMVKATEFIPKTALDLIHQNTEQTVYSPDKKGLNKELIKLYRRHYENTKDQYFKDRADRLEKGDEIASIGGFYVPIYKSLHIDGDMTYRNRPTGKYDFDETLSAAQVYAHELGHSIDHGHKFSNSEEWKNIWTEEFSKSNKDRADEFFGKPVSYKLTEYSTTDQSEGFAEFCRIVYASKVPHKQMKEDFPKTTEFFKKNGLWVDKERVGPRMKTYDVFDKKVNIANDGSHLDILKNKGKTEKAPSVKGPQNTKENAGKKNPINTPKNSPAPKTKSVPQKAEKPKEAKKPSSGKTKSSVNPSSKPSLQSLHGKVGSLTKKMNSAKDEESRNAYRNEIAKIKSEISKHKGAI